MHEHCCMVITMYSPYQAGHDICCPTDVLSSVLQVVHVEADNTMAISAWAMGSAGAAPHSAEVVAVPFGQLRATLSTIWPQTHMWAVQ